MSENFVMPLVLVFLAITLGIIWAWLKMPESPKRQATLGTGAIVLGLLSIPINQVTGIMSYEWILIPLGVILYLFRNFGPPER